MQSVILATYLLTKSSTFCPRSHCRTVWEQHKCFDWRITTVKPLRFVPRHPPSSILVFLYRSNSIPLLPNPYPSLFTFEPVGSVATASTLPVCPRQQCLAFNLFLSEFHSHSRRVWSREAVRSREVRPSAQKRWHRCFEKGCHYY